MAPVSAAFHSTGTADVCSMPSFYMAAGDPGSGPHAWAAGCARGIKLGSQEAGAVL